jgi:surface antigen
VAYVDRQLDEAQTEAVEESLATDAEARAIVAVLRASGLAVRHAYDEALDRPLPEGLRNLFADVADSGKTAAAKAENVAPFAPRRSAVGQLMALAASIALLLIGFGAGYGVFGTGGSYRLAGGDAQGEIYLAALQRALENSTAGISESYVDEAAGISGTVTITGPVDTANLGSCREFRHDAAGPRGMETSFGIACRDSAGNWRIEADGGTGG